MRVLLAGAVVYAAAGCGGDKGAPPQSPSPRSALTEKEKITALLEAVEKTEDVVLIRNNVEYPAWAGRQWLERKLAATTEPIRTAEEFIETVATGSWKTGQAYRIKFADGRTTESAYWLRARLAEIERGAH